MSQTTEESVDMSRYDAVFRGRSPAWYRGSPMTVYATDSSTSVRCKSVPRVGKIWEAQADA